MTFVGLDPDLLRVEARRFIEAAEESRALANEFREIGRIGLMEEFTNVTANQLDDVDRELTMMTQLMLRKCDEMEALLAPGGVLSLGWGRLPDPTIDRYTARFDGSVELSFNGPRSGNSGELFEAMPVSPSNMTLPRAGNWAGFDAKSIERANDAVTKLLKRDGYPTDLSDDDLRAVAIWVW